MSADSVGEDASAAEGTLDGVDAADVAALRERVNDLEAELATARAEDGEIEAVADGEPNSMVVIATKGTLDMAYPPLILASTAAAFGWDVTVFHTFWGLDVLHDERSSELKLSAVGNPGMAVPNAVAALPGMDRVTTAMMRRRIENNEVASVEELLDTCVEMGVELQACQMTMDLFGYEADDFREGVTVGVGAATALGRMADADVQLLV